jgi:hypothetical protein
MIFVIDGGSLLNQQPDLFTQGENMVATVRSFFDRFNEFLAIRKASAYFVLKGHSNEGVMSRRAKYGIFTLMFASRPEEDEALLLECAKSAIAQGEAIMVTDNANRAVRAGFMNMRTLRTSEFRAWLLKLESMPRAQKDEGMSFGSVEYWSSVFGISPSQTFKLELPEEKGKSEENGNE